MTVRMDKASIRLEGDCPVGDAETLLALMQAEPARPIDLGGCGTMHSAVIQLLLAMRPRLIGEPGDDFVAKWISPLGRM